MRWPIAQQVFINTFAKLLLLAAIAVLALLIGCRTSPPSTTSRPTPPDAPDSTEPDPRDGPIETADAARDALLRLPMSESQLGEFGRERLTKGKGWAIKRMPIREALDRVEDTLTEKERQWAIRFGRPEDLNRDGDCWSLEDYEGLKSGLICLLDAETGRLLFVWTPPEG